MRLFVSIILALFIFGLTSIAKQPIKSPIKIAVLDTGFDFDSNWKDLDVKDRDGVQLVKPKLCKMGHKDFTNTSIKDVHGHGTHLAGIMGKIAGNSDYCLIILKTYHKKPLYNTATAYTDAIKYATNIKVDIINYSGGGVEYDIKEYKAIEDALDKGIVVVAAAGNEDVKIDYNILKIEGTGIFYTPIYIHVKTHKITENKQAGYYPASYDPRIISVGNGRDENNRNKTSNYGYTVKTYERGTKVLSILPGNSYGSMSGTSQSAATRTGKIIKSWKR